MTNDRHILHHISQIQLSRFCNSLWCRHMYGFSPVCVLMCAFRSPPSVNDGEQPYKCRHHSAVSVFAFPHMRYGVDPTAHRSRDRQTEICQPVTTKNHVKCRLKLDVVHSETYP